MVWPWATKTSTITPRCGAIWPGKRRWSATRNWRRVPRSAGWRTGSTARRLAAFHQVLVEQFIASFREAPTELILDFDATDDRVHGQQEGRAFHGYYGDWCFLPLYVFCGEQLLVVYLRPSNIDAARHSWAILKLLVQRLRQAVARGEDHLARRLGLLPLEDAALVRAARGELYRRPGQKRAAQGDARAADGAGRSRAATARRKKSRLFTDLDYAAETWDKTRRVIAKAEHTDQGSNPRFVVTNLEGDAQVLYDEVYCARGEMENRIKEQQLGLFADRTSCHRWWANQFRLLLSSCAYVLLEAIRRLGLAGTELARAQVANHPAQAAENRHGDFAQHPAHPPALFQRLSPPKPLSPRLPALEQRVTPAECCPRHAEKQRGLGEVSPGSAPRAEKTAGGPGPAKKSKNAAQIRAHKNA